MAKKKYSPQLYAQVGMICVVPVVFGVLMPWYYVTTDRDSYLINGVDNPLGVWVLILSVVGAAAAGIYATSLADSILAEPFLALGGVCYWVAWVLCMAHLFGDLSQPRIPAHRYWAKSWLLGVYLTTAGALAGTIFTFAPLAALVKRK